MENQRIERFKYKFPSIQFSSNVHSFYSLQEAGYTGVCFLDNDLIKRKVFKNYAFEAFRLKKNWAFNSHSHEILTREIKIKIK